MPTDPPGIEWCMDVEPFVRGPWVPPGLGPAARRWLAEQLALYAGLFGPDAVTERVVRDELDDLPTDPNPE
jgi:hypothetical protein